MRTACGCAARRLQRYGAAMPLLPRKPGDLPPLMSRREALDRFEQHTKHCPDCQRVRVLRLRAPAGGCALPACLHARRCGVLRGAHVLTPAPAAWLPRRR
jgi:hypothetical protein